MRTSNSPCLEQQLHVSSPAQIKVLVTCDHFSNNLSGYLGKKKNLVFQLGRSQNWHEFPIFRSFSYYLFSVDLP